MELRKHATALRGRELHFVALRARSSIDHVDVRPQMVTARPRQCRPCENCIHQLFFVFRAFHRLALFIQELEFATSLAVPNRELLFKRAVRRFNTQLKTVRLGFV